MTEKGDGGHFFFNVNGTGSTRECKMDKMDDSGTLRIHIIRKSYSSQK